MWSICHVLTIPFLLLLLVAVEIKAAELIEKSIEHDSLQRWYLEYKPNNYSSDPALVILLHGGTQSMRTLFRRSASGSARWLHLCDTNGFLLLAPNGVNVDTGDTYGDDQNWSDIRNVDNPNPTIPVNDDIGFIISLVQYAIGNHNVNPNKVYVTGSSNGGIMTYTMLLKQPNTFAAGVAFIANLPNLTIPYTNPNETTPIMIMNGNKDRIMLWGGGYLIGDVNGIVRSALTTRDFWITNNHASISNVIKTTIPNRNWFDRCRIYSEFYPADNTTSTTNIDAVPVQFYTMDGGGHSMPSRRGQWNVFTNLYDLLLGGPSCHDAYGADLAWDFMTSYTL